MQWPTALAWVDCIGHELFKVIQARDTEKGSLKMVIDGLVEQPAAVNNTSTHEAARATQYPAQ